MLLLNIELDLLIQHAINYYTDFKMPNKIYVAVDETNKAIFEEMLKLLRKIDNNYSSEDIQTKINNMN